MGFVPAAARRTIAKLDSRCEPRRIAGHAGENIMRIAIAACVFLTAGTAALAQDIKGSRDHPLVPRYEGSEIIRYETQDFTDYRLLSAPAKNYGGRAKNTDATLPLEGRVTRITYRAPAERAALEVFRNYENALKEKGFQAVFACARNECGGRNFNHAAAEGALYNIFGEYQAEQQYLAARLVRPEGDVYVSLYAVLNKSGGGPNRNRAMIQLDVIELKKMEERMVVTDASAMQREIGAEGRVAVYGILFDFDKDTLRADSKQQLEEIAKLLKGAPTLKVLIVGHTDAKGAIDYNQKLSERRARAVVETLARDFGIERGRLTPVGVGMAAPVATNRTDDGRSKNRRVELVDAGA
jgi:outer membrane protein OmpA-like peptidoglycan-associated protein